MIAYFRLIRLPNVFTAIADIIAGYFLATLATNKSPDAVVFAGLCVTSAALYLSGMAFNDIADREEDARVRPSRPIPSGAVSLKGAIMCAGGLMFVGIQVASWIGLPTIIVAAVLAAAILSYDFVCKGRTFAGPIALGVCRFANILLGMSAAYSAPEALETLCTAPIWGLPWLPAIASGFYGAGVTAFSAQEEEGKSLGSLVLGWMFIVAAIIAACSTVLFFTSQQTLMGRATALIILSILIIQLVKHTFALIRRGSPDDARELVLTGVKGYCLLDTAMLSDRRLIFPALAAALMLFPGGWLRKWLSQREA